MQTTPFTVKLAAQPPHTRQPKKRRSVYENKGVMWAAAGSRPLPLPTQKTATLHDEPEVTVVARTDSYDPFPVWQGNTRVGASSAVSELCLPVGHQGPESSLFATHPEGEATSTSAHPVEGATSPPGSPILQTRPVGGPISTSNYRPNAHTATGRSFMSHPALTLSPPDGERYSFLPWTPISDGT